MQALDWIILLATLAFIVGYGTWKNRRQQNVKGYLLGDKSANWWTIGLSVMATQASAITFMSTPGQAFHSGMGFVQFYFGLPIAIVIICITFIPIYHRLKVYTAYEFLENRFDLKTRSLAAILFLVQRGLAAGITIYAPAIVLSYVLGWDLKLLCFIIGILVIIYTVSGGTKAVSVTQKQQMAVIFTGMFVAFYLILDNLPSGMAFSEAIQVAAAGGKMEIIKTEFSLTDRYNIWTGLIGGAFLALSYFGTDQSQVQRYLSGRSIKESRTGMLFNAALKVPMQFFILLVGVMVFVLFQFDKSPVFFNPAAIAEVQQGEYAKEFNDLEKRHTALFEEKELQNQAYVTALRKGNETEIATEKSAVLALVEKDEELRKEAKTIIKKTNESLEDNDKDYVFLHFVMTYLPTGLIGLLLAVIFSAAMSSTASELNALASTTTMDIFRRNTTKKYTDEEMVPIAKRFTILWGIIAILFACFGSLAENLIQLVNIIGSIFYGTILGIFVVAFYFKKVGGNAVFTAAAITQVIIILMYVFLIWLPEDELLSYLWLNFVGCVFVVIFSLIMTKPSSNAIAD